MQTTLNSWGTDIEHIIRVSLLIIALGAVWLAVMLLVGWYNPEMHLLATTSSAVMAISTRRNTGILEQIVA